MNALQLLCHLTRRQTDSLFRAARNLPAERLDWTPAPGVRSALSQLQEIATANETFKAAWTERKISWSPEAFAKWMEYRSQFTDLDQLEEMTRKSCEDLCEFIMGLQESDLTLPVEMPFPGDFKLADILAYTYWNASYHEGQINYIASILEAKASPVGAASE